MFPLVVGVQMLFQQICFPLNWSQTVKLIVSINTFYSQSLSKASPSPSFYAFSFHNSSPTFIMFNSGKCCFIRLKFFSYPFYVILIFNFYTYEFSEEIIISSLLWYRIRSLVCYLCEKRSFGSLLFYKRWLWLI